MMPAMFALSFSALMELLFLAGSHSLSLESAFEPLLLLLATIPASAFCGRYFCGFFCSFGAMQDLAAAFASRLLKKNPYKYPAADRFLKAIKFALLAGFSLLAFLGLRLEAQLSPWTIFGLYSRPSGWVSLKGFLSAGGLLLGLILLLSFFFYRPFCRWFCPMGAVYALAAGYPVSKNAKNCKNGGDCCLCGYRCQRGSCRFLGLLLSAGLLALCSLILFARGQGSAMFTGALPKQEARGPYEDGIHEGTGLGYRGATTLSVAVEKGYITSIEVLEYMDDRRYFVKAAEGVIPAILQSQSLEVDGVSGATYSSNSILKAAAQALGQGEAAVPAGLTKEQIEAGRLPELADGIYEGTGQGFRGDLNLAVLVEDGKAAEISILSYYDNEEYLFHISEDVIQAILTNQSLNVDAVTGATYSKNAIIKAVADALDIPEGRYTLQEERPRSDKDKKKHHITQKHIQTKEEYDALTAQYKDIYYNADGILVKE